MLITTTSNIEGQRITQYLGIVSGETFLGANIFRDIGAAFRDIFGGRAKAYESSLREARELALAEMSEQASKMGANAIIGVKIDYESVETILMVTASGTAVKIE